MRKVWCFLVASILLLAGPLSAQSGNTHIVVFVGGSAIDVKVGDTVTTFKRQPPLGDSVISAVWDDAPASSVSIFFDSIVPRANAMRFDVGVSLLSFALDTAGTLILHLQVSRPFQTISQNGGTKTIDGGESVTFDSLPLHANGSSLFCSGYFEGKEQWEALISNAFHSGPFIERGSGSGQATVRDSIFIEINPLAESVDRENVGSFEPNQYEVWNSIGRLVIRKEVEVDYQAALQALPPGCYFARLGNHVQKFVVAP